MELRVAALYPEQMNIYADRGNIIFLRRRCEWRGIGFSYTAAGPGDPLDPAAHDLVYIGGGQDRDQRIVARDVGVAVKRQHRVPPEFVHILNDFKSCSCRQVVGKKGLS